VPNDDDKAEVEEARTEAVTNGVGVGAASTGSGAGGRVGGPATAVTVPPQTPAPAATGEPPGPVRTE
jgi:hypothetical protein